MGKRQGTSEQPSKAGYEDMSERQEFSVRVKLDAFERCKKKCERCGSILIPGKFRYNHRIPDALGGLPILDNCEVLCLGCDSEQTYTIDIPKIARSKRIRKSEAGVKRPRTMTRWRRFSGEIVIANRQR